jgi:tRNA-2-methylthio-N6-dimethylallyladenosine synthase
MEHQIDSPRKFYLHSYGCQMNKLDSELVHSKLLDAGYQPAANEAEANVVLLNTCSVRQHAEDKVWSRLGRLRIRKRQQPWLVVGVLGCMAQEHQRYLRARMPHVDLVVGPSAFGDIHQHVGEAIAAAGAVSSTVSAERPGILSVNDGVSGDTITRNVRVRPHRSQAYVSVMRGCNMPCTYCIVPTTRGKEVSRPVDVIVEEAQRLCDDGVSEITLLGQTVNAYGRDLGKGVTLARLLGKLHEIDALRRLAFITSHPNFLSKELVVTLAELPKISPYLHLPAQSGSNRMLKAMRRGYTRERYLMRWEMLMAAAPHMELHSDWIVGYPGETDEDLQQTIDLMEQVRFSQSYVFKYSPRPGTVAAEEMVDDVAEDTKAERNQALLQLQEKHTMEHNLRLVGTVCEVLVEGLSPRNKDRLTGRTPHHRIVHFDIPEGSHGAHAEQMTGQYVEVRITAAAAHSLIGQLPQ